MATRQLGSDVPLAASNRDKEIVGSRLVRVATKQVLILWIME